MGTPGTPSPPATTTSPLSSGDAVWKARPTIRRGPGVKSPGWTGRTPSLKGEVLNPARYSSRRLAPFEVRASRVTTMV